ncbi:hydroxymethylpyrimidine/phosphomethylpyrimidine kinase [Longispora fulva]|uniref:Hydroxymethylpyrimidine/phosphomethylpyrimidine kinase n=1 Tax=Longispora fulva TaxID=619741 RepID=A0A8J7GN51_9ACTN|nr:bifunctional hydroxymethylpyrimidine kinase/phosphomethylpyrimidine kinase [Longispora fulva]MBG6140122.1 hydroxymethylpyrimidine/phosphomethylpyrimidine kinase [Longispora fulva]GIG57502.1 hydroxymethylpyrimidine/phosphomethylpyrimidine kinase [Longispora fulva]
MKQPPIALTIAGSDSGGGAGIQADLKTFAAHKVFGTSVVTALTAQNTSGVLGVHATPLHFLALQLDAVLSDLPPVAVKTGMLASPEVIAYLATRDLPNLVVDPVMVASTGKPLFTGAADAYRELFARALVVTPNLPETRELLDRDVATVEDMAAAAHELAALGPRCVVVKGGHLAGDAVDVVWHGGELSYLRGARVSTPNNHGTGCTFAAAVTAHLALGSSLPAALRAAKTYVTRALAGSADWRLGSGHGPLSWKEI